jgi:RHS repeat-associated protein
VQYRYQGSQLQVVVSTPDGKPEHATERTLYERDAFGRVTRESRWLANVTPRPGAPAGFSFTTVNRYDEAGRLVSQTLPDGHSLQYRFASADVGKAAGGRPGQLAAILFDDQVVVTDIQQSIAGGLTGYTMGNGAREQIKLDKQGRSQELQVVAAASVTAYLRGIIAGFSGNTATGGTQLYRQIIRYDGDGRVAVMDQNMLSAEPGRRTIARNETYSYDQMNRLTDIRFGGVGTHYSYDKGGNRVLETAGPVQAASDRYSIADRHVRQLVNRYVYAEGSNRLISVASDTNTATAPVKAAEAAQWLRDAWFLHSTGVPLAQLTWTDRRGATARKIVYDSARRPVAVYVNQTLSAHYHYNVWGERVAKTIHSQHRPLAVASNELSRDAGDTAYFLYRDRLLAAEADQEGRITAHFIYLYGKPVAKVEILPNGSWLHRLWRAIAPSAEPSSSDTEARVYPIITDYRGAPQVVLGAGQSIVWQAETDPYGRASVRFTATTENDRSFVMNLRLPGQVFDAETNLHYNYLRDYDPVLGRYVTPDPLAFANGTNPYAYVGNNPLTGIDPLGLYQIDVHYYMTYFLAITAGVDDTTARTIALATQYIDENNATSPTPYGKTLESAENNLPALVRYHFTEDGYENSDYYKNPLFPSAYDVRMRTHYPSNPQLTRLKNASALAKVDPLATSCSSAQFFGEYLHAFEDTFAHRDNENVPYSANHFNLGLGHTAGDENPDYTYNHTALPGVHLGWGVWNVNEERTYEMEQEVYGQLQSFASAKGKKTDLVEINSILQKFNAYPAHDDDDTKMAEKIAILNNGLKQLGYLDTTIKYQDIVSGFDKNKAANNRQTNLGKLDPKKYPGTILTKGTAPLPK